MHRRPERRFNPIRISFRAALLATLIAVVLAHPAPAGAQSVDAGWNDARTMEVVRRGMQRRSIEVVDTALRDYRADARGFVYFLLDAPELDRQSLVRTDQVAVEVFWRAPGQVRQRIVGLRERRELPVTRLYYYLDRMTVVQDNYADGIVIADGENVNDVPHPIAPGGEAFYHYRLVDSLTLRLSGIPDPVRVHEVQVRPRDEGVPAIVGSVFLEERTGALVRMTFTFTPSAYVDPRLDYINVTLENGLWQGRYWLPHEQRLEIRREMPELDLPFGTIIRTRMRIGDYRFNEGVPEWLFMGEYPISLAPRDQRQAFPFEQPIDADWRTAGIGRPAEVGEIRGAAQALLRERAISGLPRGRVALGTASDVFRYNRAEGLTLGIGGALRPSQDLGIRVQGGWAFGAGHPVARTELSGGPGGRFNASAHLNRAGDVGGFMHGSGITNTLGALVLGDDWTDPFHASGARATMRLPLRDTWSLRGTARAERQRSAELTSTFALFGDASDFRPVRSIDAGDHLSASVALRRDLPMVAGGWWGEARLAAGHLGAAAADFRFGRVEVETGLAWTRPERRARLDLLASGGIALGDLPRQELILLGGRGTLPGYDHRGFGGDRFLLGSALATADLTHPWLRGRAFGALGWTGAGSAGRAALREWGAQTSGGLMPTVGVGLGVFYDLLHVDLSRGLGPGGRTQLMIEAQPTFWGVL
jgi:hypothetical protein